MTLATAHLTAFPHGHRPAFDDLPRSGRVVVTMLRGTAAAGIGACTLLGGAGLGGRCLAALVALLGVLEAGGRVAEVAAPSDPVLTADELALHDALAALQRGRPWHVQRLLASWLAPPAVPRAVGLLAVVAEELSRAGLPLPVRDGDPMLH
jgi:hypothetical protein